MPSHAIFTPPPSARNLGVIFDPTFSMSHHIFSVPKSCFLFNRDLRRIRNTLEFTTAHKIATALIQFELDYCNSLFLYVPQSQLQRSQPILNASAQAISESPELCPINSLLNSTHLLSTQLRIENEILSITYTILQSGQPSHLHNLLTVQFNQTIRSSDMITWQYPPVHYRLKETDRPSTHQCFEILHPNNADSPRHIIHSHTTVYPILLLFLSSPRISSTLSSKSSSSINPLLFCMLALTSVFSVSLT